MTRNSVAPNRHVALISQQDFDEFIDELPSTEEIHERIADRYNKLTFVDKAGRRRPFVCAFCDEFLCNQKGFTGVNAKVVQKHRTILAWQSYPLAERTEAIEQAFSFISPEANLDFTGLALSPRACIQRTRPNDRRCPPFLSACSSCKNSVERGIIPYYAIANYNYVGCTPQCLLDLTDVELAMITPVKTFGFAFTYQGGTQMNLRGTMTFMRVKERSLARGIIQLEQLGFNRHVLIVASGRMTERQLAQAKLKSKIRTEVVIKAVEWLCQNNSTWKAKCNLDEYRRELEGVQPIFIDNSRECASENTNVEEEESFSCYYPDGSMNTSEGGFESPQAFRDWVERMKREGFEPTVQADFVKEFVTDGEESFMDSLLLQFPYGIGGFNERRVKSDGRRSTNLDIPSFLAHLSRVSQPVFQKPLFQLVAFNFICKSEIIKTSRFQVKDDVSATALAGGVTAASIDQAIKERRKGNRYGGGRAAKKLLDSCDATAKELPHTNQAAKKARSSGEALQHHFGTPSIWLTVTFDDKNSYLMQIFSEIIVDDDRPIETLTDEECRERCKQRNEIRLEFPGIAALNFEIMFRILVEEVVGWDMDAHEATEKQGFFGVCEALLIAIEEQARKTLHAHMSVWIAGYSGLQKKLFFGNYNEKRLAKATMQRYQERMCNTSMFEGNQMFLRKAFDHHCSHSKNSRELPKVVSDQQLRNLRHRKGYKANPEFAYCDHCPQTWTYEDLLCSYIIQGEGIHDPDMTMKGEAYETTANNIPTPRLFAHVIDFQRSESIDPPAKIINAAYNHHVSCHTSGCFRCSKKRRHRCGPDCECRYRFPDRKRKRTEFKYVEESVSWYSWDGTEKPQPIVEFLPLRNTYDLFQNTTCPAVSHSKFSCNSNVALVTDGPVAQYMFKYNTKGTQEQDVAEYEEVLSSIKGLNGRTHEEDRREAVRIICRAAFAHNKNNVISASLASYLLRNPSRFYFSHEFVFLPLRDLMRLHQGKAIPSTLEFAKDGEYFENLALHYLLRPTEFSHYGAKKFFETCEVVKNSKVVREREYYEFVETIESGLVHPAYDGKYWKQVVTYREVPALVKVSQWTFPDTAEFGASLLDCPIDQITAKMETYAQIALTLLVPHRSDADLRSTQAGLWPYTRKLREVFQMDKFHEEHFEFDCVIFTEKNQDFLQNIQNAARNSTRYKVTSDDLARDTEPFKPEIEENSGDQNDEEFEEEDQEVDTSPLETYLQSLGIDENCPDANDDDPRYLNQTLQHFTLEAVRDGGTHGCGYAEDINIPDVCATTEAALASWASRNTEPNVSRQEELSEEKIKYSVRDIMKVVLKRTTRRTRTDIFKNNEEAQVRDANGSVASIVEWGEQAKLDPIQRRAFQSICAAFILTFYDPPEDDQTGTEHRSKYRRTEKHLKKLRGTGELAIICLLHGPGGSGKSTVVELVVFYARDFCRLLNHPFTSRTIVVCAMSGVAATLLMGETAHSALGLNKTKDVTSEEADEFADCRMVIIDEISFCSAQTFEKMDIRMKGLKRNKYKPYGGANMVMAGDFSQLEPVGNDAVYDLDTEVPEFHGFLNAYVELDGMHRFKDDPHWGHINMRFRIGGPEIEDIEEINEKCLITPDTEVPDGIQVATFSNADRDAINSAVFEQFCEKNKPAEEGAVLDCALLVFMDNLSMKVKKKTYVSIRSNRAKRNFWENCSEDSCKVGSDKGGSGGGKNSRGRVDPVLKLYHGCPLMYTKNSNVLCGQANGSRVRFAKAYIKTGEEPFKIKLACGTTVNAVYASQLLSIKVVQENPKMIPRTFELEPEKWTFTAKIKTPTGIADPHSLQGSQFALISNTATTGHKLQGCTVEALLVNSWRYTTNWAYVVLSRVRTMKGLFLRKKLSTDLKKYRMKPQMMAMLKKFQENKLLPGISDEDYQEMIAYNDFVDDNDEFADMVDHGDDMINGAAHQDDPF